MDLFRAYASPHDVLADEHHSYHLQSVDHNKVASTELDIYEQTNDVTFAPLNNGQLADVLDALFIDPSTPVTPSIIAARLGYLRGAVMELLGVSE